MADEQDNSLDPKSAPQTRDRGNGISEITDRLKSGIEVNSTDINNSLQKVVKSIHKFGLSANKKLDILGGAMSGNKLKELEVNKEGIARTDKTNELLGKLLEKELIIPDAPKGWFGKALAIVGGLAGIVAGLTVGFVLGLGDSIKSAGLLLFRGVTKIKNFAKLFGGLFSGQIKTFRAVNGQWQKLPLWAKAIKLMGTIFRRVFGGITGSVKNLKVVQKTSTFFAKSIKVAKDIFFSLKFTGQLLILSAQQLASSLKASFGNLKSSFANGGRMVSKVVNTVMRPFRFIINGFKEAFKPIAGVVKTLTGTKKAVGSFGLIAKGFFRPLSTFFKFAFKVFAPIGRLFGKLFFPLTIIMGVFDGIKGAIDGVKNDAAGNKFVSGMFGALKGILVGIVGIPLDMLKDAVGWIFKKFGKEDVGEQIQGFSFSDMIGKVVDGFQSLVVKIIDFFVNMLTKSKIAGFFSKGIVGGLDSLLKMVLKPILKSFLPDESDSPLAAFAKGLATKGASKLGAFKYVGINVDTGEDLVMPKIKVNGVVDGSEIDVMSTENRRSATAQNQAGAIEVVTAVTNNQGNRSTTTNLVTGFDNRSSAPRTSGNSTIFE